MKKQFLDLGLQPLANGFTDTPKPHNELYYNLQVHWDSETNLVSLIDTPEPEEMFNHEYPYYPSLSTTMCEHFAKIAKQIRNQIPWWERSLILEIGSSDGVFMRNFNSNQIVGVEPCKNFADYTRMLDYDTECVFWNMKNAEMIRDKYGSFDLVYSANCMCHIPNIIEAFKAVDHVLDNNGIFIFEDPSMLEVIKNDSYDQFYDEHAHIFSIIALQHLLSRTNMRIMNVEKLTTHGGSNRIWAQKNYPFHLLDTSEEESYKLNNIDTYYHFADRVHQSKLDLLDLLSKYNKKCIGYGATSKLTTILNYCNLNRSYIEYVTDTTPAKVGKFMPGTDIPIVAPTEANLNDTDYAFLGAWNYREEIMKKERHRKLRFITHVPKVRIL